MEQFKTLEDLRLSLSKLEKWFARPVPDGDHPTLFLNPIPGRELICGIQREDYLFSLCGNWILPSNAHGLSFSARWRHLKGIHKLKSKRNPGKSIAVYWILEKADLPADLAFVPDPRDPEHYFLAATCGMHVRQLREKLIWVADRMSVIQDAQVAL